MKELKSWNVLSEVVADVRNRGQTLTNFFADEERMAPWCSAGSIEADEGAGVTFVLHSQGAFTNVYFFAQSVEMLQEGLKRLLTEHPDVRFVVDVLGPDRMRIPLEDAFRANGFTVQAVLQRMSRKTPVESYEVDPAVVAATNADVPLVQNLLATYFNAEQEQLPGEHELRRWGAAGGMRVVRGDDGQIEGFVIYDLLPAQLYLRYWFVHPASRGRGIGGKLLRAMFAVGAKTRRQYFWVKADNENAIIRYQHYGFSFEAMKNTVLAKGKERK